MNQYQEEIRRVAAKSVKDLNLDRSSPSANGHSAATFRAIPRRLSNGSDTGSSSSSSTRGGNGVVATSTTMNAAKMQYLQKVQELNLSNSLKTGGSNGSGGGGGGMNQIIRSPQGKMPKSTSATSLNLRTSPSSSMMRQARYSVSPTNLAKVTSPVAPNNLNLSVNNRGAIISASKMASALSSESINYPRLVFRKGHTPQPLPSRPDSQVLAGNAALSASDLTPSEQEQILRQRQQNEMIAAAMYQGSGQILVENGGQQGGAVANGVQYQPGSYPQAKRQSLTNIPIYENIDGLPAVPQRGHQATPPPPPPPYMGQHNIVSNGVAAPNSGVSISQNKRYVVKQNINVHPCSCNLEVPEGLKLNTSSM